MLLKTLGQVAKMAGGNLASGDPDTSIAGVSKDTRTLEKSNLYIPIVGENFDGHDFIEQAAQKGAVASLWEKHRPAPNVDIGLIYVDNSLDAFHQLAHQYRLEVDPLVLAITGSNGKTTTKDILASVLGRKFKTLVNPGNENNEIGVPLTLLKLEEDTELAVIEMGTESFGEIKILSDMAQPDISIVTNAGRSHLDVLKTVENVAMEKLDILSGMDPNQGLLIYNGEDKVLSKEITRRNSPIKTLTYGQGDFNYRISNVQVDSQSTKFQVNGRAYAIPIPGVHNASNSAAAIAVAEKLELRTSDIEKGLRQIQLTAMRSDLRKADGFTIFDDSYKSNPDNLYSALEVLYSLDEYGDKFLVLADMLDLGEEIEEIHREVGERIREDKVSGVFLYGPYMKEAYKLLRERAPKLYSKHFNSREELFKDLKAKLSPNCLVLVKGSRSMGMEKIVEALEDVKL